MARSIETNVSLKANFDFNGPLLRWLLRQPYSSVSKTVRTVVQCFSM